MNVNYNFHTICRLCLLNNGTISIFRMNTAKKIMQISSIQVWPNDNLPAQMCKKCAGKLHAAYQFKRQCEKADFRLRQYVSSEKYKTDLQKKRTKTKKISEREKISLLSNDKHQKKDLNKIIDISNHIHVDNDFNSVLPETFLDINKNASDKTENKSDNLKCESQVDSCSVICNAEPHFSSVSHDINFDTTENVFPLSYPEITKIENVTAESFNLCFSERVIHSIIPTNNIIRIDQTDSGLQYIASLAEVKMSPPRENRIITNLDVPAINKIIEERTNIIVQEETNSTVQEGTNNIVQEETISIVQEKTNVIAQVETNDTREVTPSKRKNSFEEQEFYSCEICKKDFNWLANLTRHMKVHSNNLPYKCTMCSKAFLQSSNYKTHLRIHNNERPYKCKMCDRSCKRAQDLVKHIRSHTGERPHKCSMCPKAFSSSSNLAAHVRTHTGEKPYVCNFCQRDFCQSNELTKHLRTHTGEKTHTCEVCQRKFNGSSALIVHTRTHTGEKPYNCDTCGKGFAQISQLIVHKNRHNFKCLECRIFFPTTAELDSHMNELHPENNSSNVIVIYRD